MQDKELKRIADCMEKMLFCYEQYMATQGVYVNFNDMNKSTKVDAKEVNKRRNK